MIFIPLFIIVYFIFGASLFNIVMHDNSSDSKWIRKNRLRKAFVFFAWPLFILILVCYMIFYTLYETIKDILKKEE